MKREGGGPERREASVRAIISKSGTYRVGGKVYRLLVFYGVNELRNFKQ